MKEQNKLSKQFEADNLLDIILRYKFPLIIVITATIIISAIISLTITPKYKSTVILFPASSSSVSQSLFSKNTGEKTLLQFGEEEEVEQIMQVLQSNKIRNYIIDKYRLIDHYEIDINGKYPNTILYNEYENNIKITRTEFMSVEISVLDPSSDTAALIANDISNQLDSVMNNMQKDRAEKAFKLVETEYILLSNKVSMLQDSLKKINSLGIIEFESQSEVYNDQYATALAEGNLRGAKNLKPMIDTLAKYGAAYVSLNEMITNEIKKLSELESKYVEAKVDVEQDLPHKFIVNNAVKAEKKSYPVRWLIVLISTISTFLFSLIVLVIIENLKKK
jgi:uncharacterized protein involved in exopolysaccharide biosynthesis